MIVENENKNSALSAGQPEIETEGENKINVISQMTEVESSDNSDALQEISKNEKRVKYGDLILLYENRDSIKYFTLEQGKFFQNRHGSFKHDDMYGKIYGSKIKATRGDGYVTIFDFISHLWERSMNRMTQILFNPDISMIMTFLNIRSDSIIYESGTGSGCLSTNMSQVLNQGHLYTFEFNKERAEKLKTVFKHIGMGSRVTVIHRDVVENGFEAWNIVEKAKKVLKSGGSFVSFSPCIEQIDRTMKALRENDFLNPRMFEVPYRVHNYSRDLKIQVPKLSVKRKAGETIPYEEKEMNLSNSRVDMRGHTGFLIYALNL
jgi:tRNA (adenine57-N1/adenine58-N1)-methyltransferase catalytic subunit